MLDITEKALTIVVKPTSSCNFRCKYCYHADTDYAAGIISEQRVQKMIEVAQSEFDSVHYIWHGGEPLLCGVNFFQKAVLLQKHYLKPGQKISNSIQTNGLLLDNAYLQFFKKHDFSVSISFDGPGKCNSLRDKTEEIHHVFLWAIQNRLKVASLSVVHAGNCNRQIQMYEYFKSLGIPMKFNPIFSSGEAKNIPEYALDVQEYIASLKKLFDYWLTDPSAVIHDTLEQYLSMVFTGRGRDCVYGSCLYRWIGVDHLGDIYPCGRSYTAEYKMGNLDEVEKFSDAFHSDHFIQLLKKSIIRRSKCQRECPYYGLCNGGCNNNAILEGGLESNHHFLCKVLYAMYPYVKERIESLQQPDADLEHINPILRKRIYDSNLAKLDHLSR